jgi:hypothetical protein
VLQLLEFSLNLFLLLTTKERSDSTNCDCRGRSFKFSNRCLHGSLILHPIIIWNTFFAFYNFLSPCEKFPQKINPYIIVEWSIVNHHSFLWCIGLNWSHCLASCISVQFVQYEFFKTVYCLHVGERVKLKLTLEKIGENKWHHTV